MNEPKPITEREFEDRLRELIRGRPVKIWLARSAGGRLDTVFSVGAPQGEPIRNFDHLNGFYLLGEGVTPDLLPSLHELFTQYCWSHRAFQSVHPHGRVVDLRYRHLDSEDARGRHHLQIHIPLSVNAEV